MKKKLKKVLVLILCLCIVGCGSKKEEPKKEKNTSVEKNTKNKIGQIEPKVIIDKKDIKITVKSLNYGEFDDVELKMLIENNSDKNIIVQHDALVINGIMIDALFSENVAAGKKSNGVISIPLDDLRKANISKIKDIEIDLNILDKEYDTIFTEKNIKLQTNNTNYTQSYENNGKLVFEQNNIKVKVLKVDNKNSIFGSDVYLYIENNTDKDVIIQADDVSVNGFMIDPIFSSNIKEGKKIYDEMTFSEDDLKENDIQNIKTIELKFNVMNNDYDEIFTTKTLKIEL